MLGSLRREPRILFLVLEIVLSFPNLGFLGIKPRLGKESEEYSVGRERGCGSVDLPSCVVRDSEDPQT